MLDIAAKVLLFLLPLIWYGVSIVYALNSEPLESFVCVVIALMFCIYSKLDEIKEELKK